MARKKKEPEVIIPNEYAILWNGEFLSASFIEHKVTKTFRITNQATKVSIEYLTHTLNSSNSINYNSQYKVYLAENLQKAKDTSKIITFISPLIAKMWLLSHSSFPVARNGSFFTFTEAQIDRIITKHKYSFKRQFKLDTLNSKPLLCEFEIVKLDNVNY